MKTFLNLICACCASVPRTRGMFLPPLPRIARAKGDPSAFSFAASDLGGEGGVRGNAVGNGRLCR
ncbi:MAG: hypothetical protein ACC628_22720, partial [Pirellulaceae bacterium]